MALMRSLLVLAVTAADGAGTVGSAEIGDFRAAFPKLKNAILPKFLKPKFLKPLGRRRLQDIPTAVPAGCEEACPGASEYLTAVTGMMGQSMSPGDVDITAMLQLACDHMDFSICAAAEPACEMGGDEEGSSDAQSSDVAAEIASQRCFCGACNHAYMEMAVQMSAMVESTMMEGEMSGDGSGPMQVDEPMMSVVCLDHSQPWCAAADSPWTAQTGCGNEQPVCADGAPPIFESSGPAAHGGSPGMDTDMMAGMEQMCGMFRVAADMMQCATEQEECDLAAMGTEIGGIEEMDMDMLTAMCPEPEPGPEPEPSPANEANDDAGHGGHVGGHALVESIVSVVMSLEVQDSAAFVENPESAAVVARGIAEVASVDAEDVTVVLTVASPDSEHRRLTDVRRLAGSVNVDASIRVSDAAAAHALTASVAAVSDSAMAASLNTALALAAMPDVTVSGLEAAAAVANSDAEDDTEFDSSSAAVSAPAAGALIVLAAQSLFCAAGVAQSLF